MRSSSVERYEQILAADPRSRVFVELARALLERGDAARAVAVCRQGLEHHPGSVQGRIAWGRALLASGDPGGAQDQFDIAIGLDPGNPYAYNLVAEALVGRGLFREALPALARAVALQPSDASLRARLEEATRAAAGAPAPGADSGVATPTAPLPSAPSEEPTLLLSLSDEEQADAAPEEELLLPPPEPEPEPEPMPERGPSASEAPARRAALPAPPTGGPRRPPGARTLLDIIPVAGSPAPGASGGPQAIAPAPAPPGAAEAARIALDHERELRAAVAREEAAAPPRRPGVLPIGLGLLLLAAGAATAYLVVLTRARTREAAREVVAARAGLARDTQASLAKAAEVLARAAEIAPASDEVRTLQAEVAAVRAADFGDAAARALALELADRSPASDGALAARWLLADGAAARAKAAAAVLAPPAAAAADPLLQRLAGRILLSRGQTDGGRARLERAARASPPLLGALADLAESHLAGGDPPGALPYAAAAIAAQRTHPRSVVAAAEARLALGRDLQESRAELAAVEADPGSAPPLADRRAFELAFARVEAATGAPGDGARRLVDAARRLGDSASLELARAELLVAAGRFDEAEPAAAAALRLDPALPGGHLLLARARLGLHRDAAALQALAGETVRDAWLERGVALVRLGDASRARAALERTERAGRMPAEAAVWYARADLALGRRERALALLDRLAAAPGATALALASRGDALLALHRLGPARAACAAAIARDGAAPSGHRCLGAVLLAAGRAREAVAALERAAALDRWDPEAARLLAAARARVTAATAPPRRTSSTRPRRR